MKLKLFHQPRLTGFVVKVQRSIDPPGGIMIYDEARSFLLQTWGRGIEEIEARMDDYLVGVKKLYVWAHFEGTMLYLDFDRGLPLQTQMW